MQMLASYLLTLDDLADSVRRARFTAIREMLSQWLKDKGASDPYANSGVFRSKSTDPTGNFNRMDWSIPGSDLEKIRLVEKTNTGQIFTTTMDVASRENRLDIYCTLSVANSVSILAPLPRDAQCPRIIRDLIDGFDGWTVGGFAIPKTHPQRMKGPEGARSLADEIRSNSRSLPIVVVSEDDEGVIAWPYVDEYIARDLAGLAKVVRIDDQATWSLSDEIGKLHSCYGGAIRLYWPSRLDAHGNSTIDSSVWTPSALESSDRDGRGSLRLRKTLRRIVLSTSAIAFSPPRTIGQAHAEFAQHSLDKLKSSTDGEAAQIVKLYSDENEQLKEEVAGLTAQLSQLSERLRSIQYALAAREPASNDDDDEIAVGETEPVAGEIRFYKKKAAKPHYDILVEFKDCGHNTWESAHKGDKAKKGLERLTRRSDWDNMWHCSSCTGGGMWKVRW